MVVLFIKDIRIRDNELWKFICKLGQIIIRISLLLNRDLNSFYVKYSYLANGLN